MSRWGKTTVVVGLAVVMGACTAAPKKVAVTAPLPSSPAPAASPASSPVATNVSVGPIVQGATRTISVTGTGTIPVTPDTVVAQVNISATRNNAATAANRVNSLVNTIARSVVAAGGKSSDVSAVSTTLNTNNQYGTVTYQVSETLLVRIHNLSGALGLLAKIATILGPDGSGYINTSFVGQDDDAFYVAARRAAMNDAKAAASAWAALARVSLGKIVSVTDVVPASSSTTVGQLGGGYGYQTPGDGSITINKGTYTFTTKVIVVYALK